MAKKNAIPHNHADARKMTGQVHTSAEVSEPLVAALPAILTGMQPAFRHQRTGESHLSQNEHGRPSNVHGFEGLPEDWIVERDELGRAVALHPDVIAGYWRDARFIALTQLAQLPLDG